MNTLNKQIGQRLKQARQAQKLSLSELAGRTRTLSKSRISNYEQGIRRMGVEEAQEIAEALGDVTASHLLCLDENSPVTDEELALVDRYRGGDLRGRKTVLKVAETQARFAARSGSR
ncbi:helix-turn-helix domain-containing protein [Thiohalocapsa marina]|uniref:Helix-turn-helix domain-containing protein n=1 Tax=Thiohalocapsa marina TaxID=424902 RepID=A0A5M8FGK2_9GAMM|nr:helix-turn-helix domain-containing protein [Thiohalocapsa marina]KAA6183040.1 helix-turn-helix domain-containing protein [Thiohalocapsa marina]